MSDATLFRFISSYRDEIDFRHTASGRRLRVYVHDPDRRPNPTDSLPIEADVTEQWHRYRVAARNEDVAWFRCRRGIDHPAVVELLTTTYSDLEPLTHADIYDSDEMQPSGDADVPE